MFEGENGFSMPEPGDIITLNKETTPLSGPEQGWSPWSGDNARLIDQSYKAGTSVLVLKTDKDESGDGLSTNYMVYGIGVGRSYPVWLTIASVSVYFRSSERKESSEKRVLNSNEQR